MKVNFCSSCGNKVSEKDIFCSFCGNKLARSSQIFTNTDKKISKIVKQVTLEKFIVGIGLIIVGILVNALLYNLADEGEKYWFLWGLLIFGLVPIYQSVYFTFAPKNILINSGVQEKDISKSNPVVGHLVAVVICCGFLALSLILLDLLAPGVLEGL